MMSGRKNLADAHRRIVNGQGVSLVSTLPWRRRSIGKTAGPKNGLVGGWSASGADLLLTLNGGRRCHFAQQLQAPTPGR